jgi:heme A synthase
MLKSITHAALAATLLAATTIATAPEAEARRGRAAAGIVAGTIIGLGIAGAYAASRDRGHYYHRSCYPGRQVCDVVGQKCWYNRYGEYVCKDDVRCYRREICD